MASATSWSGDVGDQLAVTRVGDATAVVFSGGRCVAAPIAAYPLAENVRRERLGL